MIGIRINPLHPPIPFSARIKLPKGWVNCPLCGKHYVLKGKAHPRTCSMIQD